MQAAEHQSRHQRPTGDAEGQLATAGQRDRDQADQQTDDDPHHESDGVERTGLVLTVPEERRHLVHPRLRGGDPHPVADVDHKIVGRQEVDVPPAHASRGGPEPVEQSEFAQRPAGHRVVGHGDAAEVQGFAVKFEVQRRFVAEPVHDVGHHVRGTDHRHHIAGRGPEVVGGDADAPIVTHPREPDPVVELGDQVS